MKTLILLLFTATACVSSVSAESAQPKAPALINVTVMDRSGERVRLTALLMKARDFLYQKAPETRTNENIQVSALVDCSGKQASFRFVFFGKVGEAEYSLQLDSKGRLKGYHATPYEEHMTHDIESTQPKKK